MSRLCPMVFPFMTSRATRRVGLLTLWSVATLNAGASAQEGGIEVFAAGTLFSSGLRASVSTIHKRKGTLFQGTHEVSDPLNSVFEETRIVTAIDYGLRPDLTVSLLMPFVYKSLDTNAGDFNSFGLGDMAVLGKYRAYKTDWERGTFQVATIAGLEVPTGVTDATESGVRLSPGLQPGLGSWNPFFGLSANLNLNRFRFDWQAFYKVNTEGAQNFEKGDFLALEMDVAYRFLHTQYPGPTASARIGLQWRHEDQDDLNGVTAASSGSRELLLRPGLAWHPAPNIDISFAVDVPVYQDYDGTQLGLDYRTFLAFGIRF